MKTQLSKCLIPRRIPICLKDEDEYMQVTVSMNGCGVSLRKKIRGGEVRTKNQFGLGPANSFAPVLMHVMVQWALFRQSLMGR